MCAYVDMSETKIPIQIILLHNNVLYGQTEFDSSYGNPHNPPRWSNGVKNARNPHCDEIFLYQKESQKPNHHELSKWS